MSSNGRLQAHARVLRHILPWTKAPLVIGAPMRIISGPALAVKVSEAGGLGFIGPGAKPEDLADALDHAKTLLSSTRLSSLQKDDQLPIGVGFQTWAGNLAVATDILQKTPVAVIWLFAPRHGQAELDDWSQSLRSSSPNSQIWIQVASVKDAISAATSPQRPNALIVQSSDAGGHSLTQGAGLITLLPEVSDALAKLGTEHAQIPLIAAGGIIDSRGASAAFSLGASGVTIGTRLLASKEAVLNEGYQAHVLNASDGGQTTVRTQLYNHLRGTTDWPEGWDARGIANLSWKEHVEGVAFEELKRRHDEAMKHGSEAWGENGRTATYAGTGIGLIDKVISADEIVDEIQNGVRGHLEDAVRVLEG